MGMYPVDILLVEDSIVDAKLISKVFAKMTTPHRLHRVSDGAEAIEFLEKIGQRDEQSENCSHSHPRPDLILLDLNLPKLDGRAVLRAIKSSQVWQSIPTIILSTSDNIDDIQECYALHANAYLIKPDHLEDLFATVQAIESFWLTWAKLPVN